MFYLLPPTKLISIVAALYAVLFILLRQIFSIGDLAALRGAVALELLLLLFGLWGWRKVWAQFPALNGWFFPDLNGEWRAEIAWVRDGQNGKATGKVHIKQDFFKISIEVDSPNSDSQTQVVVAKRDPESGRPMLHYVYTVNPRQYSADASPTYEGAALLKVDHQSFNKLEGNYFTSRATTGHFNFVRM